MIHRRHLLAAGPALILAGAAAAQSSGAGPSRVPPIGSGDIPLGSASARVQVIEYASLACGHCAQWHAEVWPAFKRRYVDSGMVRFAVREMLTEPPEMAAAGAMLARCAPAGRYYDALDALFANQQRLFTAERPIDVFGAAGARAGLSMTAVTACLSDRAGLDRLNRRVAASVAAGVQATPTFVIGDRRLVADEASLAGLGAAIDPLLTPAQRTRLSS